MITIIKYDINTPGTENIYISLNYIINSINFYKMSPINIKHIQAKVICLFYKILSIKHIIENFNFINI